MPTIRTFFANLCGHHPSTPTTNKPKPRPIVDTSQQLAKTALESVAKNPKLRHRSEPPPRKALVDLPLDILPNIVKYVQDTPTLHALSRTSKILRKEALRGQLKNTTLDDLLHIKGAKEFSTSVLNLAIDPLLDIENLAFIQDWEFPSLQSLTIGNNINRQIKYKEMNLLPKNHPIKFESRFSSELFVTHPHLSKISTLKINQFTKLIDDFSGFQACKNLHTINFLRTSPQTSRQQLEQLSTLPLLETLSFDGTGSIDQDNCVALPSMANVKSLTLNGCLMFNPVIFEQIANMPELVNFSFNDAHEDPGVEALKTLMMNSPKLKRIECKRFWISHENILELKDVASTHGIDLNIEQNSRYKS